MSQSPVFGEEARGEGGEGEGGWDYSPEHAIFFLSHPNSNSRGFKGRIPSQEVIKVGSV